MPNKKIKNATICVYDKITFKSKLEVMAYKTLKDAGLNPLYEAKKFIVMEGFRPTVPFYRENNSKQLVQDNQKIRDITYTPDFLVVYKNVVAFVEMKGQLNDSYPIKRKMFRKLLEDNYKDSDVFYFEIKNKRELLSAIKIIKNE